jgi:signal transduction histidine kinase
MRRQFLRVYLGLALVLVLAALAIVFFVERELRELVKHRTEEVMEPLVRHIRLAYISFDKDKSRQLAAFIEPLDEMNLFPMRITSEVEVGLPQDQLSQLEDGLGHLHYTQEGRMVYARLDDDVILALGPLPGRIGPPHAFEPGEYERHDLRGGQWNGKFGRFYFQVTYFLIGVLLFILAIIGVAVYYLLRPYERRIYKLANAARDFGEGKFDSRTGGGGTDAIGNLARTFDDMADRTSGLIERQQELLRAVSHELRTPLARLFFMVDDAQSTSNVQEKNRHLVRIDDSLNDLNDLVEELLTFVRLDGQDDSPTREAVDVARLLSDVGEVVADLYPTLQVKTPKDMENKAEIDAVSRLLHRAVLNLATNAAKHAREKIVLGIEIAGGALCIHIDDDGPGIPVEAREKIFEPFVRLDKSRNAESGGLGLGLALVQRIAAAHEGRVEVVDSPLGGARFTLIFPCA